MRRPLLCIVLFATLIPLPLMAGETAVLWPAPEPDQTAATGNTIEDLELSAVSSSASSKSAWINQGDWLFERLGEKGLRIGDPVHLRVFKQSRELELFVQGPDGFELYRTYPVCDMSGSLGPKRFEGDYQAPEGFYTVVPERLHPHSDFHLAFNLGYPNDFDRTMGRTGSNIMIHGGCASNGCFAMTDYYMEQIYVLVEAALQNGQREIGVEIYPFRMTAQNLAAHASSRWIDFWRSLKPAHDHFVEFARPARVDAETGSYRLLVDEPIPGPEGIGVSAP